MLYDFSHKDTFEIFEFQINNYLNHIKKLDDYANKHFKKYEYMSKDFVEGD